MAMSSGDTAWVLTSSALVLFMTMPGLALYYSGMTPSKNVLSTLMQSLMITCLITTEWMIFGYSFAFAPSAAADRHSSAIIGNTDRVWLLGLHFDSVHQLAPTIPEAVYIVYQLTFAIITPALICGSYVNRMTFSAMSVFTVFWHLVVYCPIVHSIWHPDGFLYKIGVLDFAGGDVVHISAGTAGLVAAIVIGKQRRATEPYNLPHTFIGMAMLWVGWFGFNAGSAVSAGSRAAFAMLATQIAAAVASLSWLVVETAHRKKPSVIGMINGSIAGLASITPASGYVDPTGAFFIGLLAGPVCYYGSQLKHVFGYDDTLDTFGIHGIGGIVGGLATGFLSSPQFTAETHAGVIYGNHGHQLLVQLAGIAFTLAWSGCFTFLILIAIDKTIGLRVSEKGEDIGLDEVIHGETINSHSRRSQARDTVLNQVHPLQLGDDV